MTSFVYDFKDIASRMKGEMKASPEPEPIKVGINPLPQAYWRLVHLPCRKCGGDGDDALGNTCYNCGGTGVEP